ncbi:MAG TPA: hypothetical protein VML55_10260 [Planctomycetaceae bacterium]|nr:hypothetical protein [Planctomycetaceae bacterium]
MPRFQCKQCRSVVEARTAPVHCFDCGSDRRFAAVADEEPPSPPLPPLPTSVRCTCGVENTFEDEDRGTDIYCVSCGSAVAVPDAALDG